MRKFISLIISFALFAPFFNLASYASLFATPIEGFEVRALQFPEDEAFFAQDFDQLLTFYSNPSNPHLFGSNLTPSQKKVYDMIVEQQAGLLTDGAVNVQFPMSENIKDTVQTAVSAVIDDYPEFFWLGGYSVNGSSDKVNYNLILTLSLDTNSYANWDILRESYYSLLGAVESFEVKGNTRYDKLKSMHDQICEMTTYTLNVPMAHHPTGVFLNGKAVCEGYAEALKLLCDREGIPCIIVVGTGNGGAHEWNYVQMEDGKWYGMDVTWDDQDTEIFYDYFLVGSESVNAVFGKTKFGNGSDPNGDHINSGTHFSNAVFPLTYPVISEQSYSGVIPMWNSTATFDNSKGLMYIAKDAVANEQILCTFTRWAGNAPSTNKAVIYGTTTGGKLDITSPVVKTYTIVRRGDANKDGIVNDADNNDILSIVQCERPAYTDEAQFAAADINGDGVIDAFDAIENDLYCHGVVD